MKVDFEGYCRKASCIKNSHYYHLYLSNHQAHAIELSASYALLNEKGNKWLLIFHIMEVAVLGTAERTQFWR